MTRFHAHEKRVVDSRQVVRRLRERGLSPRWRGDPPAEFEGLYDDSRAVREGGLFCAVRGTRVDAHRFLAEARDAGAAAAVVEAPRPELDLPQLVVDDTRLAVAHLASLFAGDPAGELRVHGVTGTNGKTTTAWTLRHVLAGEAAAAAVGTLGVVDRSGRRVPRDLTTPGPIELMEMLRDLRGEGAEHVAMEASSHALDQRRVDGINFASMAFTNLGHDHLDYHGTPEAYRRAKLRAARLVAPSGACVVNRDDRAWRDLDPGASRLVTYGRAPDADVRAVDVEHAPHGSVWTLQHGEDRIRVATPLPGSFNVSNSLAAAAAALAAGLSLETVGRRLGTVPQVPGRMEVLLRKPCLVVRDFAHTPEALRKALEVLRPEQARLCVVFGCGGDRDATKRAPMGRAASEVAHRSFVTTDNPRSEDPESIAREVVRDMDPGTFEIVLDRREAIRRALLWADPADVVLLAGKGHETYQAVGDRKEPFDEARIVEELTREIERGHARGESEA
ncbi:MAG: UDP-N-acetylmuramoyl-L-alanyl-D-glutamate--2,6-diaminopimelate ligase [Gemmatimonadota bacterium]